MGSPSAAGLRGELDELDNILTGEAFGLTEEQAEFAERIEDIVGTEGSVEGNSLRIAAVLEVFAECDISLDEISGGYVPSTQGDASR